LRRWPVCQPLWRQSGARLRVCPRVFKSGRRSQVEFPQILSAYDSVAGWVTSQGLTAAGSPREVYFTDFKTARSNDEVCDVALPVQ
jgi:hypothetical protein